MNELRRLLRLPWLAIPKPGGWWVLPVSMWFVFTQLAGNSAGTLTHASWRRWACAAFVAAVWQVWQLLPNLLNLVRDANAMGVPGIGRAADRSLLLYALLTIALPGVALGAGYGHPLVFLVLLTLVASTGFAAYLLSPLWALLPLLGLVVLFFTATTRDLAAFAPFHSRFLVWAAPAAIAFGALAILRWRALRSVRSVGTSRWNSPGVFNNRRMRLQQLATGASVFGAASMFGGAPGLGLRRREVGADTRLYRMGPAAPVRSIRLALDPRLRPADAFGPGSGPFAVRYRLPLSLVAVALTIAFLQHLAGRALLVQLVPPTLMLVTVLLLNTGYRYLQPLAATMDGRHGGVSLLAMLPGLGPASAAKACALRACLDPVAARAARIAIALAIALLLLRLPALPFLWLILVTAAALALPVAIATNLLGGRPLRNATTHTLEFTAIGIAAALATAGMPGWMHASTLRVAPLPAAICLALWALWFAAVAWLAVRGWRALRRRPHPFLANPSA